MTSYPIPKARPQNILIVGGGQGIGLNTLKSIIKLSPTARILVFSRYLDAELQTLWSKHHARITILKGDVTSPADRLKAVEVCVTEWGGIDTLVYTAGVITPIEAIEKVDLEGLKKAFDVNVFGAVAMSQLCIPHLRTSSTSPPSHTNSAYGKILILSSACDADVTYRGWMPYCTTKAALTRFIQTLAHEERHLTVQGVYPKLTRTKMAEDIIAGKYKGVMADHEVERFRVWNELGDPMVEPPERCGEAVAKLAIGLHVGGPSGETLYYEVHVPSKIVGT